MRCGPGRQSLLYLPPHGEHYDLWSFFYIFTTNHTSVNNMPYSVFLKQSYTIPDSLLLALSLNMISRYNPFI